MTDEEKKAMASWLRYAANEIRSWAKGSKIENDDIGLLKEIGNVLDSVRETIK